jgi:hypothetical protein
LIFERVPVRVREVALPDTVTPPPLIAAKVPLPTSRVTATVLVPASASEKLIPITELARSSFTEIDPSADITGISLVAATEMVRVALTAGARLSLTETVTVLEAVDGASLEFEKVTARMRF